MTADDGPFRARLASLEAAGAPAFDAAAWTLVQGLLARAAALDGPAGDRLRARAEDRAARLESAFDGARARANHAIERDARDDVDASRLTRALEAGDLVAIQRNARRRARLRPPPTGDANEAWLARLRAEAQTRGVSVAVDAGDPRAEIRALASALYDRALDDAAAAITVANAVDDLPLAAGPYNPRALAARALGAIGALSPGYLRAQIARLQDLGALFALPPDAPAPRRARPRAR